MENMKGHGHVCADNFLERTRAALSLLFFPLCGPQC